MVGGIWGQTRSSKLLTRSFGCGCAAPSGSGRRLGFHLGNRADIEVANVSDRKGGFTEGWFFDFRARDMAKKEFPLTISTRGV
jgi:hypothetical protein